MRESTSLSSSPLVTRDAQSTAPTIFAAGRVGKKNYSGTFSLIMAVVRCVPTELLLLYDVRLGISDCKTHASHSVVESCCDCVQNLAAGTL